MPSFSMPNVGEGVTEGEVTRWLKAEGEFVARDEPVVEIETDKAVVEIPSPFEGTLAHILVQAGEIVPVGTALGEIEGSVVAAPAPAAAPAEAAPVASAPPPAPEPAEAAPVVPAAAPTEPAPPARALPPATARPFTRPPAAPFGHYSPAVLKLAREHDVDLAEVHGTGRGGRVTRKDVLRYLEHPRAAAPAPAPTTAPPAPLPPSLEPPAPGTPPLEGDAELVRLSATRRAIARHMAESHATIPLAWMAVEADVTGLVALRAEARDAFEQAHGLRLTFMPFFVQAFARSLGEHPELNSTYSDEGLLRHERLDLGIAVATESGLIVPVLRDANRRTLPELAGMIDDLASRARDRSLAHEELQDATLTVDNTGAFGSVLSQPIVPVGQVAIVTTEAIRRELRIIGDSDSDAFAPRSVMNLAISFDHRALDGAEVGAFMADVKDHLEAYAPGQPVA